MLSEQQAQTIQEAEQTITAEVSLEEYMETYAEHGYEWVEGEAIKLVPIGLRHENIRDYLRSMLQAYFALKPIGRVLGEPFLMILPKVSKRRREPDLMVILNTNSNELTETYMSGPADICIEIVSPASVETDHGDKFAEYEKGGVTEYWIIDPIRNECRFYRLNDQEVYVPQSKDSNLYTTALLPGFMIDSNVFWQESLPNMIEIVEIVKAMLKAKED